MNLYSVMASFDTEREKETTTTNVNLTRNTIVILLFFILSFFTLRSLFSNLKDCNSDDDTKRHRTICLPSAKQQKSAHTCTRKRRKTKKKESPEYL
jgi:hypothetical protein